MRTSSLKHWALFSAPLLAMLAVVFLVCGSEAEVAVFFKDHRTAHPALKAAMTWLTDWYALFDQSAHVLADRP